MSGQGEGRVKGNTRLTDRQVHPRRARGATARRHTDGHRVAVERVRVKMSQGVVVFSSLSLC